MKDKFIMKSTILFSIFILLVTLFARKFSDSYITKYNYELLGKGLELSNSFDFDDNGNIYISYKNKIFKIKNDNSKEEFSTLDGKEIGNLKIKDNEIYLILDNKLMSINLGTKKEKTIIDNIPNYSDVSKNKILILNNSIFLTIDSATNSGIIGEEDLRKNRDNKGDISPIELELKGTKFGLKGTGAFSEYGTTLPNNKVVPQDISTGSIIKVNLSSNEKELYSFGIRNIAGIDVDNNGTIYATMSGMDEIGDRPLYGDSDYIYVLDKKNKWYGWPDYSGGDPVNSARFRKEGKPKQEFIIKKHPDIPPAPFYQSEEINSLGVLAIDCNGFFGIKDSLIIYDNRNFKFISLNKSGEKKSYLTLIMDIYVT